MREENICFKSNSVQLSLVGFGTGTTSKWVRVSGEMYPTNDFLDLHCLLCWNLGLPSMCSMGTEVFCWLNVWAKLCTVSSQVVSNEVQKPVTNNVWIGVVKKCIFDSLFPPFFLKVL